MPTSRMTYLSWAALLAALAAWGLVGLCIWTIQGAKDARAFRDIDSEQTALRETSDLRAHSLVRETKDARAALESQVRLDVVAVVEAIENVGKDARVEIDIGQALSSGEEGGASAVRTLGFIVEAKGSFAGVMHAAALLLSLPVPSAADQLHFERIQDAPSSSDLWRLTVRIEVFTTADISS